MLTLKEAGEGKLLGYILCVDSMHKRSQVRFDPSTYENAIALLSSSKSGASLKQVNCLTH